MCNRIPKDIEIKVSTKGGKISASAAVCKCGWRAGKVFHPIALEKPISAHLGKPVEVINQNGRFLVVFQKLD